MLSTSKEVGLGKKKGAAIADTQAHTQSIDSVGNVNWPRQIVNEIQMWKIDYGNEP